MHRKKLTMILSKELFIIAISMFKATMMVQTTWAIIKMRPNVDDNLKAGSSTTILSSSTKPTNSQNIPIKVCVCLKYETQSIITKFNPVIDLILSSQHNHSVR